VESITRCVGRSKAGIRVGLEPVAMMQCSNTTRSSAGGVPSIEASLSVLRILERRAGANNIDLPLGGKLLQSAGERGDDLLLAGAATAARSMVGSANATPQSARCLASSLALATCSSAFDGMQPRRRQTPPSRRLNIDQCDL